MLKITSNVYALFWLEAGESQVRMYDSNEMSKCLTDSESLRIRKRNGENISHITFCSENPDRVGLDGVAEADLNYSRNHWKRRDDPSIPVGRESRSIF